VMYGDAPAASPRLSDHEHTVGSDPAPAVAKIARPCGGHVGRSIHDHEVVPAAVHLRELHAAASTISGSGSVAVGSNQRIAASRRNQVSWRREEARTSRAVRA